MNEPLYFACSATLRISAPMLDFELVSRGLGVQPTYTHRSGDRRGPRSPPFKEDMWSLGSGLAETEALQRHIDALWEKVRASSVFLLELKRSARVDVFLGYRSNCDHAGFEVPHTSLEMFRVLEVPFGVSVIIT